MTRVAADGTARATPSLSRGLPTIRAVKPAVFLLALVPLAFLGWRAATDRLSPNPIEDLTRETGVWTLRFLVLTLAITPVRWVTGWNTVIRYRRMIGLFAFFYGTIHLLTYVWFDQFFDLPAILKDIGKRPFITVGMLAFVAMVPLAVTSTTGWIRRLGGRRWRALHRLVYVAATAGAVHYYWQVKADVARPIRYGVIVGVLLLARVIMAARAAGTRRAAV
jgi:sulfoxide reductase heme-binding subunit YedZ